MKNDLFWYNTLVVKRLLRYSVTIVVVKKLNSKLTQFSGKKLNSELTQFSWNNFKVKKYRMFDLKINK